MTAARTIIDDVYFDRNQLAKGFATLAIRLGWTVGLADDPDDPDWPVLVIDTPAGQVSYHIHGDQIDASRWPRYPGHWDGHTTHEKRVRMSLWLCEQ